MWVDKQINYSKSYSSQHSSKMKWTRAGKRDANTRYHADVLSKRKLKNSAKNLSAALQAIIDQLDNELGYMGEQETLQA